MNMEQLGFPIEIGATRIYGIAIPAADSVSDRRAAERSAVRALVEEAFGRDAVLEHDAHGAPYIKGADVHISVSHGAGYALLAVSHDGPVGVDIEAYRRSLPQLAPRFMEGAELAAYGSSSTTILKAWTAKEALFKAVGNPLLTVSAIRLPDDVSSRIVEVEGAHYRLYFIARESFVIALAEKTENIR